MVIKCVTVQVKRMKWRICRLNVDTMSTSYRQHANLVSLLTHLSTTCRLHVDMLSIGHVSDMQRFSWEGLLGT